MGTVKSKDDRPGNAAGPSPELTIRSDSGQSGASGKAASGQPEGRANVVPHQRAEDELQEVQEQLRFESFLAELSARFVNLPADQVDAEIHEAQRRICEFLGLDLSVLWQRSDAAPGSLTPTHLYSAQEGPQPPGRLNQEDYPWVRQQLLAGRIVVFSSLEELPAEAAHDREVARQAGIKSNLTIPLSVGGESPMGVLALNTTRAERDWPDALVKRLQLVAQIFTNALARKRTEQALRESESRLSLATEAAGAGLWVMNLDGSSVWASAKTREFFRFEPDQPLTYQDFIERIHPEDREMLNRAMQHAIQSGEELRIDYRIPLPDGQTSWLAAKGGLDGDPGKPQTRIVGVSIDITKRKQAEEALAERELHHRTLFEAAPVGIIVIGTDGLVKSANPVQARLYGHDSPQQLIGQPAILFVAERDREQASENMRSQLRGEDTAPRCYTSVRRDGSEFISEVTGAVIRGPQQEVQGYLCITRDITQQQEAEESLRAAYAEIKALKDRIEAENRFLRSEIRTVAGYDEIIGQSEAIHRIVEQAEQVAPTDSTVLIQGQTGTGKELLAHVIHMRSPRSGNLFVTVNLASLPSSLLEAELFGREKGAYTGALTRQTGRFEMADGGTVFLDEIGEMPLETQAKLLRVLQQGEFERLGSTRTLKVNVRIIAATNRDLAGAVRSGQFREDLYYRLNVFPIRMPPLSERREDIPLLVWSFVKEFGERMGKRIERISHRNMEALQAYSWPGNVRELRNVMERSMILTSGADLRLAMPEMPGEGIPASLVLADADKQHILSVLEMTGWRVSGKGGAAERLGLKPSTLESKMKKLGIRRAP